MYKTASKKLQHHAGKSAAGGFSEATIKVCRNLLVDLAKSGRRSSYGDLAAKLGIANQSLWACLDPIAEDERKAGRPDLTVILHYAGRKYGKVAPRTYRAYREELRKVYMHWGGKADTALVA
jgi:hypothetical protein